MAVLTGPPSLAREQRAAERDVAHQRGVHRAAPRAAVSAVGGAGAGRRPDGDAQDEGRGAAHRGELQRLRGPWADARRVVLAQTSHRSVSGIAGRRNGAAARFGTNGARTNGILGILYTHCRFYNIFVISR